MNKTIALVLFLLSVSAQFSFAEEYVVGVEDVDYYPIYARRDGAYAGYSRALLDAFAEKQGHTFQYKMLPIKRLFKGFLNGDLDFKFPDSPDWQQDLKRNKKVVYSEAVLEYIDGVLVHPDFKGSGKDNLKTLGVLRGFTAWDYLDDAAANTISIKEVNSMESLVKMINVGRINGVYFNVVVAKYFLENTLSDNNGIVFDSSLPHTQGNYYLSTIKHPKLIQTFNKFLEENRVLVESLKNKYDVKVN